MAVFSGKEQAIEVVNRVNKIVTVGEIANRSMLKCELDTPVYQAARQMRDEKCSSIIVVDNAGTPQGIWTERDALAVDLPTQDALNRPISDFMSTPIKTIREDMNVEAASTKFREGNFRHFLVVNDNNEPVGMVTQTDIILSQGMEHYLLLKTIKSILSNPLLRIDEKETIHDVALEMRLASVDAVAVVNQEDICVGIITERDIIHAIAEKKIDVTVAEITSKPMLTIDENATLLQARSDLSEYQLRHLGVCNDTGDVIGILSFSDILCSVEQHYVEQLREMLRDRDEALKNSSQNLLLTQKVIESSLDAIVITNADNVIEYVNKAFTDLTGYSANEVYGKTPAILSSGRQNAAFYKKMWQAITTEGAWQGEIWNKRKNGEIYPEKITINAIYDLQGEIIQYAAIFSDISDRKIYEEQIQNLAYYDTLTSLPNRRLFQDRLDQAILQATRHDLNPAVLFLDLDLFKRINDTLGHTVGDRVLKAVANRLSGYLRGGDSISRLGGDEFTVLLQEANGVESAAKLAQRLIREISKPLYVDGREFYLTVSAGVAVFPYDGEDAETLLRNADTAMYKAKEQGRNNFQLYTPSMNEEFYKKLSLENQLRRAVEHDQFFMVYQPKTNALTGETSGLEALARWEHPEMGLIRPDEFIAVAEALGIINQLGEDFFRKVCTQWRRWVFVGMPKIPIAVNLSLHQFRQENLAKRLLEIAEIHGMDPHYLEIEITESTFMHNLKKVVHELNILRDAGVSIAIDDFGTGYSSFSYLKKIPIDTLKIDKSFVDEIADNEDGAEIVSAIIAMAHQLKLEVVAEGVETKKELDFLREQGCDHVQGYYYAKPMNASQVVSYLKS